MSADGQRDEFDLMADWTADVLDGLSRERAIAGACNGSASPMALAWLAESLRLGSAEHLVDIGCGLGGALAWAHDRYEVHMLGVEPMESAARRGAALFGHQVIVGSATELPLGPGTADRAWMLGVLDTIDDQARALESTRSTLTDDGRLGLLAYVAREPLDPRQVPEGNHFPTEAELARLLDAARLVVLDTHASEDLLEAPVDWRVERDRALASVEQRHGDDVRWSRVQRRSRAVAELLEHGAVAPMLVSAACV